MEDLLERETLEFEITEDMITCDGGELEYSFENDCAIVNAISVYYKRNGIGTRLVNEFENLALSQGIRTIEVPASPTREAVLFWYSLGYEPDCEDDITYANKIKKSYKETPWKTSSGVVVLKKRLEEGQ